MRTRYHPRYQLTVPRDPKGRALSIILDPTEPGWEALRINVGPAMHDHERLMAVRLARMVVGTPSSVAWAYQYDL